MTLTHRHRVRYTGYTIRRVRARDQDFYIFSNVNNMAVDLCCGGVYFPLQDYAVCIIT